MSRRLTLLTREMGSITLLVYEQRGGLWDPELEPLRGTRIGDQIAVLDQATLDHGLHGLSRPLVEALGIPPAGALRKLPGASKQCRLRSTCVFYAQPHCHALAKKMPWCFEPDSLNDEACQAATKVIAEWREGVYVVVIKEPHVG
jgi:hypothetical protein